MTDHAVNDLLCGSKQIGHYLGISPYQAWRWLEAGKLPGFKMGGMWYLRVAIYEAAVQLKLMECQMQAPARREAALEKERARWHRRALRNKTRDDPIPI